MWKFVERFRILAPIGLVFSCLIDLDHRDGFETPGTLREILEDPPRRTPREEVITVIVIVNPPESSSSDMYSQQRRSQGRVATQTLRRAAFLTDFEAVTVTGSPELPTNNITENIELSQTSAATDMKSTYISHTRNLA